MSDTRRRLGALAASAALSLGVALLAGEIFVRASRPSLHPDRMRAHSLEYEATLFARHALPREARTIEPLAGGSGGARIGSRGTRGRDFAVPKPEGKQRVLVLGGSAAYDPSAAPGEDWPRRVEARLHALGHGAVEVVNAGTPGHASWDSVGRLLSELWMFEPDWVLVYHAWNDIKYFAWLEPERSLLREMRPGPTRRGRRIWNPFIDFAGPVDRLLGRSELYLRLRNRYWQWQLGQIGPEGLVGLGRDAARRRRRGEGFPDAFAAWGPRQFALDLKLILAAARHVGARPALLTQARLLAPDDGEAELARMNLEYVGLSHAGTLRAFEACDRVIHELAREEAVPLLDLGALNGRDALFDDHIHLSPEGSAAVAAAVAEFLAPRL